MLFWFSESQLSQEPNEARTALQNTSFSGPDYDFVGAKENYEPLRPYVGQSNTWTTTAGPDFVPATIKDFGCVSERCGRVRYGTKMIVSPKARNLSFIFPVSACPDPPSTHPIEYISFHLRNAVLIGNTFPSVLRLPASQPINLVSGLTRYC